MWLLWLISLPQVCSAPFNTDPHPRPLGYGPHAPMDQAGHGFTITQPSHDNFFISAGQMLPGRGTGHLVARINLMEFYHMADILLSHSRDLFESYMASEDVPFRMAPPPPMEYEDIRPPSPMMVLSLAPMPGWSPSVPVTADQAVQAWYYLGNAERDFLARMSGEYQTHKERYSSLGQYLLVRAPHILHTVDQYLQSHDGPFPHQDTPFIYHYIRQPAHHLGDNFVPYTFAALYSKAATIRASAAALSDLPSLLGTTSLRLRSFYVPDRTANVSTRLQPLTADSLKQYSELIDWDEVRLRTQETHDDFRGKDYRELVYKPGVPEVDEHGASRPKRALPAALLSAVPFLVRAAPMAVKLVQGLYSAKRIADIMASVKSNQKDTDIVAVQVDTNSKSLYDLASRVDAQSYATLQQERAIAFNQLAIYLEARLDSLSTDISRAHNLLSAVATRTTAGAMAASYELQQDMIRLKELANQQNTEVLLNSYADLFSCPSSFTLTGHELTLLLHVPLGRSAEVLDLFQLVPTPFPIGDNLVAEIQVEDRLLAVNRQMSLYTSISPDTLSTCAKTGTLHVCQGGAILRQHDLNDPAPLPDGKCSTSCLFAVFSADKDGITRTCDLKIGVPTAKITQTQPDTFIITTLEPTVGVVDCRDGVSRRFPVEGTRALTLNRACSASVLGRTLHTGDEITILAESSRSVTLPYAFDELFNLDPLLQLSQDLHAPNVTRPIPPSLSSLLEENRRSSSSSAAQLEKFSALWSNDVASWSSIASVAAVLLASLVCALGLAAKVRQFLPILHALATPKGREFLAAFETQLDAAVVEQPDDIPLQPAPTAEVPDAAGPQPIQGTWEAPTPQQHRLLLQGAYPHLPSHASV